MEAAHCPFTAWHGRHAKHRAGGGPPRRWPWTGLRLSGRQDADVCRIDSVVFVVKQRSTAPGGLPGHLRSLGGSSKSSGMMVSHVRRGALTAHFGIRGARPRPNCWAWMPGSRMRADARQEKTAGCCVFRVDSRPARTRGRMPAKRTSAGCRWFACRQSPPSSYGDGRAV